MTATRPGEVIAWPLGVPRTCANGDGRPTLVTLHGTAYCGVCALEALRAQPVAEVS